jgi:hypothetical protein
MSSTTEESADVVAASPPTNQVSAEFDGVGDVVAGEFKSLANKSAVDWIRNDVDYSRRSILATTAFIQPVPAAQPSPDSVIQPIRLLSSTEAADLTATTAAMTKTTTHTSHKPSTRKPGKGTKGRRNHVVAAAVENGLSTEITTIKTCEAIDRWDQPCAQVVVGGHKGKVSRHWCAVHQLEELKVVDEFLGESPPSSLARKAITQVDFRLRPQT